MRHEGVDRRAPDDETPRRHPDQLVVLEEAMCQHKPRCPGALTPDRTAARVVACHAEQGWSLLCNGVVLFDDGEMLLLDERAVIPDPAPAMSRAA
jgi:hypothetical protein